MRISPASVDTATYVSLAATLCATPRDSSFFVPLISVHNTPCPLANARWVGELEAMSRTSGYGEVYPCSRGVAPEKLTMLVVGVGLNESTRNISSPAVTEAPSSRLSDVCGVRVETPADPTA